MTPTLHCRERAVGPWLLQALAAPQPSCDLATAVLAPIGNSVANTGIGKARSVAWKRAVAEAVRRSRGAVPCDPGNHWAITLGFGFYPPLHGNGTFDVENFIKPTLDAVAAGLFSAADADIGVLARWNHDDSNFRHILVHRLPDVGLEEGEGAALSICGWRGDGDRSSVGRVADSPQPADPSASRPELG